MFTVFRRQQFWFQLKMWKMVDILRQFLYSFDYVRSGVARMLASEGGAMGRSLVGDVTAAKHC